MTGPGIWRIAADLSTLANALSGVGAIEYVLHGNKLFAMFLLLTGVGWDGLDGFFSRRAGGGGTSFGRVADSLADAVTFCLAPAVLVNFNTFDRPTWVPWDPLAWATGAAIAGVGIVRLVYYTTVAYRRPHFSGASTPQNTMWLVFLVLLFEVPGFLGEQPWLLFAPALLFVPLMVLPLRYPKLRRGAPLRSVAIVLSGALALALISANLVPWVGTPLYELSFVASALGFGLLLLFYLAGPLVTRKEEAGSPHGTPSPPHA